MSYGKRGQKLSPKLVSRMPAVAVAPIYGIDQAQYRQAVTRRLRLVFSNERNAVKRVAEIAGATQHAAKNWLADRCSPGAFHLSRLRAAIPELDAEIRKLETMDADNDPAFARELQALVQRYVRPR